MITRWDYPIHSEQELSFQMASLFHGAFMEALPEEVATILHQSQLHPYTQHLERRNGQWHWVLTALNDEMGKVMEARAEKVVILDNYKLQPNKMQVAFLKNLKELCDNHVQKALLLSATGTGKSLASAFAMRELKPRKMLFLVHREQIAKQTLQSYQRVFGSSVTYGLLSGNSRQLDADFLFSTMQMMAKQDIYSQFAPDEFDAIVLDECHHAGSGSYQRIMNYFKPSFWLGI